MKISKWRSAFCVVGILCAVQTLHAVDTGIDGGIVTVSSLTVTGPVYISTLTVSGPVSISSLTATGNLSISTNVLVGGTLSVTNNTVTNYLTAKGITVDSITVNNIQSGITLGKVKQIISATSSTSNSTTSTSFQASAITASITPTDASSKILILANIGFIQFNGSASDEIGITIYRGASTNLGATEGMLRHNAYTTNVWHVAGHISYLDSPSATSETTYTVRFKTSDSGTTVYVGDANTKSSIILMEIL